MIAQPLWTTVGVCRCVFDSTMSMKSLPVGTTWMVLKLYRTILACGLTALYLTTLSTSLVDCLQLQ